MFLARKEREHANITETRRQLRLVSPDGKCKDVKEDNEYVQEINDFIEYITTTYQELNESISYVISLKVNCKRKRARCDSNIERLKHTIAFRDNIISKTNKEIVENNKEINRIKYNAKEKL